MRWRSTRRAYARAPLGLGALAIGDWTGAAANFEEAAATLFVSPKTIEFHLSAVYRKLEISSRSQLARLFAVRTFE